MPEPSAAHSWVWTAGAAALVAGAIFGQQVVVHIPAPDAPEAPVRAPGAASAQLSALPTAEEPGRTGRAAAVGAAASGRARPAAASAASAPAAPASDPTAVPEAPRRLTLREATNLPWTAVGHLLAGAGAEVEQVERELGPAPDLCDLLGAADVLRISERAGAGGSVGCRGAGAG